VPGRRRSATTTQETEIARLTNELDEARQQLTATADVLDIISRSTFDLAKVLSILLESAARLCEADKGNILRPSQTDAHFYVAANYRHTPEYDELQRNLTYTPGRGGVVARVLSEGRSVQIPDVLRDPEYSYPELIRAGNFRTILGVPLLREGIPIGVLVLQRAAIRPFNENQVKLVETFANQAAIAIEKLGFSRQSSSARANSRSRWNGRRPRLMCFKSSAVRSAILSRCFNL
jgi:GAF domain-containing protein